MLRLELREPLKFFPIRRFWWSEPIALSHRAAQSSPRFRPRNPTEA